MNHLLNFLDSIRWYMRMRGVKWINFTSKLNYGYLRDEKAEPYFWGDPID